MLHWISAVLAYLMSTRYSLALWSVHLSLGIWQCRWDSSWPDATYREVGEFLSNSGIFHTPYIQYLKHKILTAFIRILCPPHIFQYLQFQGRGILLVLHHSHCFLYSAFSFQIWLTDHLRFDLPSLCLKGEKYRIVCKTFRINRNGFARKARR